MAKKVINTVETAEARAEELSKVLGRKVRAIVLQMDKSNPEDLCVGFVQEPFRMAKAKALGIAIQSTNMMDWAIPLYESGILVEHSDARMDPLTGDDDVVISAAAMVGDWFTLYNSAIKKK